MCAETISLEYDSAYSYNIAIGAWRAHGADIATHCVERGVHVPLLSAGPARSCAGEEQLSWAFWIALSVFQGVLGTVQTFSAGIYGVSRQLRTLGGPFHAASGPWYPVPPHGVLEAQPWRRFTFCQAAARRAFDGVVAFLADAPEEAWADSPTPRGGVEDEPGLFPESVGAASGI